MRLTKIYTRKGDEGYTNFGSRKLSKDDLLIDVLGTLDELNANIGLVVALKPADEKVMMVLTDIQNELFDFGGELFAPEHIAITAKAVLKLEKILDEWNSTLPPLQEFLLPRGPEAAAACHVARTVCRRAERCLVRLHRSLPLTNKELLRYLNRLSDLLFVMSRIITLKNHGKETMWKHECKQKGGP